MGYRHYFYLVKKEECNSIAYMTFEELTEWCKKMHPNALQSVEDEPYINFHEMFDQRRVFEFGKLYYDDTAERICDKGTPLFARAETQECFSDYCPYRVEKNGVLEAISIYKEKIIGYYKNLLTDGATQILPFGIEVKREDIKSIDKLCSLIEDQLRWWNKGAISTKDDPLVLSDSWLYEHQIFNLAHILKIVDWDEMELLFYGY